MGEIGMETDNFIVSEELLNDQCSKIEDVLGETEKLIIGDKSLSKEARWVHLQKAESFYHIANQVFANRYNINSSARVPYYYEMMAIMEAMAISFGVMSAESLPEADEEDMFYDPVWIKEMAVVMHKHYRNTAQKGNAKIE